MSHFRSLFSCKFNNAKFDVKRTLNLATALFFNVGNFKVHQNFSLDDEWKARFDQLNADKLAGSYDWITTVQKKFASSGKARF